MKAKKFFFLRMGSDYLADAVAYRSLEACKNVFRVTADELARYGQEIEATVHIAESREDLYDGDYPDYVLSLGPRGGLRCERA